MERWFEDGVGAIHCLTWDAAIGLRWARLLADLRASGLSMPIKDSLIAATALTHGLAVVTRNRRDFGSAQLSLLGQSLHDLRSLARREIVAASTQYHREAGEPIPDGASDTWLVAGHQPELFC